MSDADPLFLGLDLSTQSLKALAIDAGLGVVYETAVSFDDDLPDYGTEGGAHRHADGVTVTTPTRLWVEALDLLLERMKADGFAFGRVAAISGSGQQHGSIYFAAGADRTLGSLDPARRLGEQLAEAFTLPDSPIWQDTSTSAQCQALEAAMGGPQAVAQITGSRAYERFTGNQIAKIAQTQAAAYEATERIALVSSFTACLLSGGYAPIDVSDGSGMNLMDIWRCDWHPEALAATAPDLQSKLGPIVRSHEGVGAISPYYVKRYGFDAGCRVLAFSGDNPNSLAGLRLQHAGDVAVSLGTSDTLFAALRKPTPLADEGHIFRSPVDPDGFMAMVVRKNGSLTREAVRDRAAGGTWESFADALAATPPGNDGRIGFYFDEPEITPRTAAAGVRRFAADDAAVESFPPAAEVRAVVESGFVAMRRHGQAIGIRPASVLATGGASQNAAILQVIADVFGVDVHVAAQKDSAALGAAYRARHGWQCEQQKRFVPYAEAMAKAPPFRKAATPERNAHGTYNRLADRYQRLEQQVSMQLNQKE